MGQRETYADAVERYMEKYAWDTYCTPTWKYPVSLSRAQRDIREFVSRFGDPAYAYVAYERGKEGGRIHAHLSLGGLNPIARNRGYKLWHQGQIHWDSYRPGGGAARYMWKDSREEPESGEFLGTPRRRYPRKRGRRGRGSVTQAVVELTKRL